METRIREAAVGEEELILPLWEWLFAAPGQKPDVWDPEHAHRAITEAIVSPQSTIFVADEDGRLVGFCTAYLEFDSVRFGRRCWVEDLAVDPERRSGGIGAALLAAAMDWARGAGASHLELDSGLARTDAHRFYEREGGVGQSYSFHWPL
jgi:GNAT superfamily N-acetyltransferase